MKILLKCLALPALCLLCAPQLLAADPIATLTCTAIDGSSFTTNVSRFYVFPSSLATVDVDLSVYPLLLSAANAPYGTGLSTCLLTSGSASASMYAVTVTSLSAIGSPYNIVGTEMEAEVEFQIGFIFFNGLPDQATTAWKLPSRQAPISSHSAR